MDWKTKSAIQKGIAMLPCSRFWYYKLQRTAGNLRAPINPIEYFERAMRMLDFLHAAGANIVGKRLIEVGTGPMLGFPTALWLCGAEQITTVDLNPLLRAELVEECHRYMRTHVEEVTSVFAAEAEKPHFRERLDRLLAHQGSFAEALKMMHIEYLSPADATRLAFPDESFDMQFSSSVMEHIPGPVIGGILKEARRIVKKGGTIFHEIDLLDHYATIDPEISTVNFLQYDDRKWEQLNNRFMYVNRLRAPEYLEIFREAGTEILKLDEKVDEKSLALLRNGFTVDRKYQSYSPQQLAVGGITLFGTFAH